VIGSHEDIQAAKLEDVKAFFRSYYAPNNASLTIVGDIDKVKVKKLVEKYYGTVARGEPVPAITATTPPITSERRAVVTDQITLPRVYMAWLTAPVYKPGDAEAGVAANILGGGKASRLYKSLVYEKQICQDVTVAQQSYALGSVFQITATVKRARRRMRSRRRSTRSSPRSPRTGRRRPRSRPPRIPSTRVRSRASRTSADSPGSPIG
jgi:zinc protease